jgi:exosome complex RNA-binding protein Rrp42 (RNase PH superfamily)
MFELSPSYFVKQQMLQKKRVDSRNINQSRKSFFNFYHNDNSYGSSLFKRGKTIIAAKVTGKPQPLFPSIEVSVIKSLVSNKKFKNTSDQPLTSFLTDIAPNFIDLSSLIIARPDEDNFLQASVKIWVWKIQIIFSIISDDGSIDVCLFQSLNLTLNEIVLPVFELTEQGKLIEIEDKKQQIVLNPMKAIKVAKFEDILICDPSSAEESISEGTCSIMFSENEGMTLHGVFTNGFFPLNENIFSKILQLKDQ